MNQHIHQSDNELNSDVHICFNWCPKHPQTWSKTSWPSGDVRPKHWWVSNPHGQWLVGVHADNARLLRSSYLKGGIGESNQNSRISHHCYFTRTIFLGHQIRVTLATVIFIIIELDHLSLDSRHQMATFHLITRIWNLSKIPKQPVLARSGRHPTRRRASLWRSARACSEEGPGVAIRLSAFRIIVYLWLSILQRILLD